jgi:L-fuculose-phosphate aldolase
MTDAGKREAIVEAARELERTGLNQGSAGNISLRDGAAMLITPSGVAARDLRSEAVARVALDDESGASAGPLPPSSEWRFHRDILRARPDANAIVHTHSPYATVLAVLRRDIPAAHYMIAAFGGACVRCTDYAPYGTAELSRLAVEGLAGRHAVLLGNHGAIVTGADLERAMWRAVELEALARTYYLASLLGQPVILPDDEIERMVKRFESYGVIGRAGKTGGEERS